MRNLVTVIDQMLEVMPASERGFIEALNSARHSAIFSAPELMRLRWEITAECLEDYITVPTECWQQQLVDIWMDRNPR